MYDPALGRFHTLDAFAEKYLDFTPYQYAANNPILFIDVNGDSTYTYNMETGALTMIDDTGGDEFQTVNFVDGEGKAIMIGDKTLTTHIDGETAYVTDTREGTLVSAYDPLEGLSENYNSETGYEYTASDLVVRHRLQGTKAGGRIAGAEANGMAGPLAGDTFYDEYVEKWGTNSSFYFGAENYMTQLLPGEREILVGAHSAMVKAANRMSARTFNPNYAKVKSPISNSWNRYQRANKGSGKSTQQLRDEYMRLKYGK